MREGQRIGARQVAHAELRAFAKVRRVGPEPRPAPFIAEEQRRLAELAHQLAEQLAALEEPFAEAPWNHVRQSKRRRGGEHLADALSVAKFLARADDEHFQPFAARDLPAGDDVEAAVLFFRHQRLGFVRRSQLPSLEPRAVAVAAAGGDIVQAAEVVVLLALGHQQIARAHHRRGRARGRAREIEVRVVEEGVRVVAAMKVHVRIDYGAHVPRPVRGHVCG